jgi:hypothetical protein
MSVPRARALLRDQGLSLFFLALFLATLAGQAVVGHAAHNEEQALHGEPGISLAAYVTSPGFAQAVTENWQSEYLQFVLFIFATVWLVQRGSPESKAVADAGPGTDRQARVGRFAGADSPPWARAGGWRTRVYENSLVLVFLVLFLLSWFAQSVSGWREEAQRAADHGEAGPSWAAYVTGPRFWEDTLQNWQSEFLAVGSMVIFAVFLRQRGSAESKPVGDAHAETGEENT